MAQDNTLGAPTEGLGQTVTFAGNGGNRPPVATAMQRGSLRAGQQGGEAVRTAEAIRTPDSVGATLFQTLTRFGSELIKPKLEEERAVAFTKGMQQAAQGQAITEIVDEQPWYSKAFGATSLVDGARAYSAAAKATAVATEIEAAMPELRKMSANEISKHVANKMLSAAKTGDATTDAMITNQVAQTIPSVLKMQAKEHLRYQQEMLESGISDSLVAQGTRLGLMASKARSADSIVEDADAFDEEVKFTQLFVKPAEMDKKLHDKIVAESVGKMLGAGNFAAYDVLERSGKMDELSTEDQYRLRRARQQASTEAKAKMPVELLVKAVEFRTMSDQPGVTWEDQIKARDEVNAEYTRLTGDTTPLIDNAMTATEMLQRRAKEAAEAKRLAQPTAQEIKNGKAFEELSATQSLMGEALSGQFMIGVSDKDVQAVFDEANRYLQPAAGLAFRVHQYKAGIMDKGMQKVIEGGVKTALAASDPIALAKIYQTQWLPIVNQSGDLKTEVANAYAGKDAAKVMNRYHQIVRGKPMTDELMATAYFSAVTQKAEPMDTAAEKKVVASLTSGFWNRRWKNVTNLLPGKENYPLENPNQVASWIKPELDAGAEDVDADVALAIKRSDSVTVLGGIGWQRTANSTRLSDYFDKQPKGVDRIGPNEQDAAFKAFLDKRREDGKFRGEIQLIQTKDVNGVPMFGIVGTNFEDATIVHHFSGADVLANHKALRKAAETKWAFGDAPITHRDIPQDGRPSLYAGDAAWKAWAEKQRK